jgi:hypothetical protein
MNNPLIEPNRMNDFPSPPVLRRERAEISHSPYSELRSNMTALREFHSILQTRDLTSDENMSVFLLMVRRLELEDEIRRIQHFFRSFAVN